MKQPANDSTIKCSVETTGFSRKQCLRRRLKQDILMLCGLATACMFAGLSLNQMHDEPLPLVYMSKASRLQQAVAHLERDPLPNTTSSEKILVSAATVPRDGSPRIIDLEEFRSFVQAKHGLLLDSRPEIFYRLGHVPGALSISREEFERDYANQRSILEPMRNEAIVVYCSSTVCEDSEMVADTLKKLGYQHILVFKGGWEEWTHAGLPEERR